MAVASSLQTQGGWDREGVIICNSTAQEDAGFVFSGAIATSQTVQIQWVKGRISLSEITPGVYFLRARTDTATTVRSLVVK